MNSTSVIAHGLALERELKQVTIEVADKIQSMYERNWIFADWLANNTKVSWSKSDKLAAIEPQHRAHMVTISEYAKSSSFSKQHLIKFRQAALITPQEKRVQGVSASLAHNTWKALGYNTELFLEELPKRVVRKGRKTKRDRTLFDAIEDVSGAKRLLDAAVRIIAAADHRLEDEDMLITLGSEIAEVEALVNKIAELTGMVDTACC